jgi:hypothetical protein
LQNLKPENLSSSTYEEEQQSSMKDRTIAQGWTFVTTTSENLHLLKIKKTCLELAQNSETNNQSATG